MVIKLRASKISIETPKEGAETWVHITVQKIFKDDKGNTLNIIPRFDYISMPLQDIGMNIYNGIEPLTQEKLNLSGYATASLISAIVIKELLGRYGGVVTKEGDVIL